MSLITYISSEGNALFSPCAAAAFCVFSVCEERARSPVKIRPSGHHMLLKEVVYLCGLDRVFLGCIAFHDGRWEQCEWQLQL
jgi:hypothetical protein